MEAGRYTIHADVGAKLLEIELRGFWTRADAVAYRAARDEAMLRLRASGVDLENLLILVDARQMSTQSQDVIDTFQRLLAGSELQPRRSAMVLSSTLGVMQVRRIGMPGQRLFTDVVEARAWLHAD